MIQILHTGNMVKFDLDSSDFWSIMGFVIAILASSTAAFLSYKTLKKDVSSKSYSDLDTLYMKMLQIGMEYPEFRDPEKTQAYKTAFTGNKLVQYDVYAYMVWNVCETVYDRTKEDKENKTTWEPIVIAEKRLHNTWLENTENHHKFKKEFVAYVQSIDN